MPRTSRTGTASFPRTSSTCGIIPTFPEDQGEHRLPQREGVFPTQIVQSRRPLAGKPTQIRKIIPLLLRGGKTVRLVLLDCPLLVRFTKDLVEQFVCRLAVGVVVIVGVEVIGAVFAPNFFGQIILGISVRNEFEPVRGRPLRPFCTCICPSRDSSQLTKTLAAFDAARFAANSACRPKSSTCRLLSN